MISPGSENQTFIPETLPAEVNSH